MIYILVSASLFMAKSCGGLGRTPVLVLVGSSLAAGALILVRRARKDGVKLQRPPQWHCGLDGVWLPSLVYVRPCLSPGLCPRKRMEALSAHSYELKRHALALT